MLQRGRWNPRKPIPAISGLLLSCHFTLYTQRWQRACRAEGGSGPLLKNTRAHGMFYFWLGKPTMRRTILKYQKRDDVASMPRHWQRFVLRVNREKWILSPLLSLPSATITGSGVDHGWERLHPRIPPVHLQRGRRSWDGDDSHVPAAGWDRRWHGLFHSSRKNNKIQNQVLIITMSLRDRNGSAKIEKKKAHSIESMVRN